MATTAAESSTELPLHQCPICLENWNSKERIPKFLKCHHTVCLSCAKLLFKDSLSAVAVSSSSRQLAPPTPTSPLARIWGSRSNLSVAQNQNTKENSKYWITCPMCRSKTEIDKLGDLQTNFYLHGLPRSSSTTRLVLWCDTCSCVAKPECQNHSLLGLTEKLQVVQDELTARMMDRSQQVQQILSAYEHNIEVYEWMCFLMHKALKNVNNVLACEKLILSRVNKQHTVLLDMRQKKEALLESEYPQEEIISEIQDLNSQLEQYSQTADSETPEAILQKSFDVLSAHRGPRGYQRALLVLDVSDSVTFSLFEENEREPSAESDISDNIKHKETGMKAIKVNSLLSKRRKRRNLTHPIQDTSQAFGPSSAKESSNILPYGLGNSQSTTEICNHEQETECTLDTLTQPPSVPQIPLPSSTNTGTFTRHRENKAPLDDPETPLPKNDEDENLVDSRRTAANNQTTDVVTSQSTAEICNREQETETTSGMLSHPSSVLPQTPSSSGNPGTFTRKHREDSTLDDDHPSSKAQEGESRLTATDNRATGISENEWAGISYVTNTNSADDNPASQRAENSRVTPTEEDRRRHPPLSHAEAGHWVRREEHTRHPRQENGRRNAQRQRQRQVRAPRRNPKSNCSLM